MDERREEREELAALERDDTDDARQTDTERDYWREVVMLEAEA